jgi:DNA-directed RNA polymerase subunit RPC12/RpoP
MFKKLKAINKSELNKIVAFEWQCEECGTDNLVTESDLIDKTVFCEGCGEEFEIVK